MSVLNPYFASGVTQGTSSEQDIIEDLVNECLNIYSVEVQYIPRTLVSKDELLGEDRLSKFENTFPIAAYFENIDQFDGGGYMIQKFGLMVEQSATLSISKRNWNNLIGSTATTILPNRPAEGDLIYFPLSRGLFEIKFVDHKSVFYQLGKLYVYKLNIELFQYASEQINTGNDDIDVFETLKSFDQTINSNVDVPDSFGDNTKFKSKASGLVQNTSNIFGDVL